MPAALVEQLAAPGRMFIPIGVEDQGECQSTAQGMEVRRARREGDCQASLRSDGGM